MLKCFFIGAALLVSAFSFAQRMPGGGQRPTTSTVTAAGQASAERKTLESQRDSLQQAIAAVKRSLTKTHRDKQAGLSQLALLQHRLSLREAAIRNTNNQIRYIQSDMQQSGREVGQLQEELDTLRARYAASIVFTYKNRHDADLFHLIFSSASLYEAVQRVEYMRTFHAYEEERAENILRADALLKGKIEGLRQTQAEKDAVLARQRTERRRLVEEKKEKDAYVVQLRSREKDLRGEMMRRQRQEDRLSADIALSIRRAREAERRKSDGRPRQRGADGPTEKGTSGPTERGAVGGKTDAVGGTPVRGNGSGEVFTTPADIRLSGSFESRKGRLPWPVDSRTIAAAFGVHTYMPGIKHDNPGITIAADGGSVVQAVAEGVVLDVYPDVDAVVIRHGKYFTTYSNVTGIAVAKGEDIKAGQVIGRVSAGGQMDFWLTDEKGHNLDPEKWLRR